jgi:integrase
LRVTSLAAGVPLHVVSRRLGHASEAFTAQVYAHILPQQGEHAAAAFAALVAGAPPESVREL